ncbi:MAG: hypothetical protein IJ796_05470 [Lachnospiraceae bacterium]|nr:hypothetical protein [Lachnospiraceae bacterium]
MKRKALMKTAAAVFAAAMMLTGCSGGSDVSNLVNDATTTPEQTTTNEPETQSTETPTTETEVVEEPAADPLAFEEGTVLVMSCGYNNAKTGMRFDAEVAGEGVTLADGVTYHTGDFKPTWVEIQNLLGFEIDDQYAGDKDTDNYTKWTADEGTLASIDMFSGSAAQLQEGGAAGNVLNIAQYLDVMPNFKAFLDANPVVRMSLTGSIDGDDAGAIYGSPYFDGLDDIEKMPLMRTDWVVKLLDGEGEFTADSSDNTAAPVYQPYMPTSGKVTVDIVKPDGSGVTQLTKDYDTSGNIVAKMNEAGSISGVEAVNMLRTYIDECYAGFYGTERSNLFIGQSAAWDADEMVALLRCVVANSATLNADGNKVQGLFSREENNNSRRADLYRLAGILYGVRGLESRQDYLFFDKDGTLHDARQEDATYTALLRLNDMVKEGLIAADFVASSDDNATKSSDYVKNDTGFMSYDYNQTQTIFNEDGKLDADEKYMAVMIPVAKWDDGTGETYMRFTESWRSAKTGGWAIAAHVADDVNKLHACLKLIDYAYTYEGQVLLSYGPAAFRDDSNTFDFYGTQMPRISEQNYADLWSLAGGNYTNFARQYLGSTLSFNKTQAFENECTTAVGKEGPANITNAINLGVIKHPALAVEDNMFYTIVPTVLPTTDAQNDLLKQNADLNGSFSTSKLENNVFLNVIIRGTTAATDADAGVAGADAASMIANDWNGATYLQVKNQAWTMLQEYANANF